MSTRSASSPTRLRPARAEVDWRRAEFVLTGLALVGFVTLLIRIRVIYGGLPAHPLFIHVPVILIPLSVIGALAVTVRPAWFERYGILLCLCAIVAMSSIFLAMQAGGALSGALHLTGPAAELISQHSFAAKILAICFSLFTAALIVNFASHRIRAGRPTGLGLIDTTLSAPAVAWLLRAALIILALVCAFYVYRVGDLGARAVWEGRLQAAS